MPKAAFIDRDGIINIDNGYVHNKAAFTFVPGIFDLCLLLQKNNYQIIVITNQSGIARGLFTEEAFNSLTGWMRSQFKDKGISITRVYHCPHHPTKGKGLYKKDCACRKPAPGMILKAQKELGVNLENSMVIGDKESDILAGINAGIPNNFLITDMPDHENPWNHCKQFTNLEEFIKYLSKNMKAGEWEI